MKNRDIIVVGIQPWDLGIGSNCRNIAEEFSKHNRVLYVNYALDRITRIKMRNSELVRNRMNVIKGREPSLKFEKKNLWSFTPPVLLESINWINNRFLFNLFNKKNNRKFAAKIKKAIKELGFKDYIIFNDNDIIRSVYLKEYLKPVLYTYYIRDYFIGVDYWKKHGTFLEKEITSKADLVLSNSNYLKRYTEKFNKNSVYIGSGCDVALFNKNNIKSIPEDFTKNGKPVIGYVGSLKSSRLDLKLIEYIAKTKPDMQIVLVGPEDKTFLSSNLHNLKNVKFLGSKPLESLPLYISTFDVCINPQVVNPITIGNYPRKIDEYLVMGKPVVATKTDAMDVFEGYVYLAETKEEFTKAIDAAVYNNSNELEEKRIAFASEHTWENNVKKIYKEMERTLNERNI